MTNKKTNEYLLELINTAVKNANQSIEEVTLTLSRIRRSQDVPNEITNIKKAINLVTGLVEQLQRVAVDFKTTNEKLNSLKNIELRLVETLRLCIHWQQSNEIMYKVRQEIGNVHIAMKTAQLAIEKIRDAKTTPFGDYVLFKRKQIEENKRLLKTIDDEFFNSFGIK